MKLKAILLSIIITAIAFGLTTLIKRNNLLLNLSVPLITFIISFLVLNKTEKFKNIDNYDNNMGKISLVKLRKQVKKLEDENKKVDQLKKLQERSDNERMILNKKLQSLKSSKTKVGKFKGKLKRLAIRSKPLARRLKSALDEAARRG